jgi:chaperonin GroES
MLKPINDFVLVKKGKVLERTAGGLYVPPTARDKEKTKEGEVVAVGDGQDVPGVGHVPPKVKKGDRVLYDAFSDLEYVHGDDKYALIRERDIYGIL